MHDVMNGIRVLEVAQFWFVPSAAAVLADWGADVIKVEHLKQMIGFLSKYFTNEKKKRTLLKGDSIASGNCC